MKKIHKKLIIILEMIESKIDIINIVKVSIRFFYNVMIIEINSIIMLFTPIFFIYFG